MEDLISGTSDEIVVMNTLDSLRDQHHQHCIVCRASNNNGWGFKCQMTDQKEVVATFEGGSPFQGYPNTLHGGVISSLLDEAMTHCMCAHGHAVVTVELRISFRHPAATDCPATIRAWLVEHWDPFYMLKAELVQCDRVMARAEGKFVDRPSC